MICYWSFTKHDVMHEFLLQEEMADAYLEKPLPKEELLSLLKLLNLV